MKQLDEPPGLALLAWLFFRVAGHIVPAQWSSEDNTDGAAEPPARLVNKVSSLQHPNPAGAKFRHKNPH